MGWRRFFFRDGRLHPAWRAFLLLPLYFLTVGLVGATYSLFFLIIGRAPDLRPGSAFFIVTGLISTAVLIGLVFIMRRFLDGKSFRSLGFEVGKRLGVDIGFGLLLGALLMVVVFGFHVLAGWARTGELSPLPQALWILSLTFLTLLPAAFNEELLFRGYFLQNLEEAFGTGWAVAISSLVFSLLHLFNPHFSVLSFVNIALAGVFFAIAYLLTRNLWLPTALHFSWNYFQGPILGFPVSGIDFPSILALEIKAGSHFLSGGAFGPEGGITGTIAILLGIAILFIWAKRNAPKL